MESAFESVVERRIREAMESGEFDDLPGTGEPLPDAGKPYDELWWVRAWLKRNNIDVLGPRKAPDSATDGS